MKKTKAKGPVKKLQEPKQINQNEKEMDKIANDMAVLFEKEITASSLAEWIAIINLPENKKDEVREFIWNFGFLFLPFYIKCNTKIERIEFLKKEIIEIFDIIGKEVLYESIGLIGTERFKEFCKLRSDADMVREFMKHLTTFACLCEMYNDYVFYQKQLKEAA